jgi:cytochrome P450
MNHTLSGPRYIGPLDYIRAHYDMLGVLQRLEREYGDPFLVPNPSGPMAFTGHPDGVRTIFTADPDTLDVFAAERLAPFFGAASLVLVAGARHKRDRKLLTPPFHGARMRAYGRIMVEIAERAAARWPRDRPFSMLETAQSISLDVILRAVFGVEGDERTARFKEATIRRTEAMMSPIILIAEFTRRELGGFGPWARFRRASDALDALIYDEIAARRRTAEAREDILSLMMSARYEDGGAMSDSDLRDELLTLLFAGHETTATAIAWAFYWLHRQPEERERLLGEIDALGPHPEPDALAALPYLDAICQETLRIHPVVTEVGRLLREPLELRGCTIPAGTAAAASVLLLHYREDLYPEPHRFRPARFLERKFSPFEYIPFGGGSRRCIGAAFAMYEMKIVLATLLSTRRLRLASDAPVRPARRGVTMGPKGGVRMILDGKAAGESERDARASSRT